MDNAQAAFPKAGSHFAQDGMSIRTYIATAALSNMDLKDDGKFSNGDWERKEPEQCAQWAAAAAVRYADALIAELQKH